MNAVELLLLVQELKPLHVPSDMAGVRHDLEIFHGSNEALLLLLEISLVSKRQCGLGLLEHLESESRGRFALGMEMSFQRGWFLGACGPFIQNQVTRYGESGSRSRKGLYELSSGSHRLFPN